MTQNLAKSSSFRATSVRRSTPSSSSKALIRAPSTCTGSDCLALNSNIRSHLWPIYAFRSPFLSVAVSFCVPFAAEYVIRSHVYRSCHKHVYRSPSLAVISVHRLCKSLIAFHSSTVYACASCQSFYPVRPLHAPKTVHECLANGRRLDSPKGVYATEIIIYMLWYQGK